jgi:hypothetical protein
MPRHDDLGIPPNAILIRAVQPDWVREENGTERLTSATFSDGQLEASCFIAEEVGGIESYRREILPELSELLRTPLGVATVAVERVRSSGLWIYRKPEEFKNDPAHVVICPPDGMSKKQYKKRTGALAPDATLVVSPAFRGNRGGREIDTEERD